MSSSASRVASPSLRIAVAIAAAAAVLLPGLCIAPGGWDTEEHWRLMATILAAAWMAGLAVNRAGGWARPIGLTAAWLFLRTQLVLPPVAGPEDLPAVMALLASWPGGSWMQMAAVAAGLVLAPWSLAHLAGALPHLQSEFLLLGIGAVLLAVSRSTTRPHPSRRRGLGTGFAVVLLFLLCRVGWSPAAKPGRVLFEESHASYGSSNRAMAGLPAPDPKAATGHGELASLLSHWGYRVERMNSWSDARLGECDVLVLPLPTRRYAPTERRAIEQFVRGGGGLLAIGDHTGMEGVMESLNPVLAFAGMGLNFDTVWLNGGQRTRVAHASHPLAMAPMHLAVANGASVSLSGAAAFPLLALRWGGYGDEGDPANLKGALLGDSRFDRARENCRDLDLAGAATAGSGRVVLLGDSAYLQNGGLYDSPVTARGLFHWLNHREVLPLPLPWLRWLAVLAASAWLLSLLRAGDDGRRALAALASASLLVQLLTSLTIRPAYTLGPQRMPRLVIVDQSHGESLALYHRRRGEPQRAIDGVMSSIQAAGKFPWIHSRGSLASLPQETVDGLLLPAPRTAYSAAEIDWIQRLVDRGGQVLLVVDRAHPLAPAPLLARLGLTVSPLPVAARKPIGSDGVAYRVPGGPLGMTLAADPIFDGANPLAMERPFELAKLPGSLPPAATGEHRLDGAVESLATFEGGLAIARIRQGEGAFVVMADPALLENSAIEGAPEPVRAVRWRFFRNLFRLPASRSARESSEAGR